MAVVVRLLAPIFTAPAPAPGAQTPAGEAPPTEFRIWAFGDIDTEKGKFKLTKASAAELMKRAQRWGNDFPIDWNHAMLDGLVVDPAESNKAAGWFKPELRDDGLWATNVRWTPLALKKLSDKEYRYYSPAFSVDEKGAIVGLTNIALTNLPATREMEPLVASQGKERPMDPELKKFLETLQAGMDARFDKLSAGIEEAKKLAQAPKDDDDDDDDKKKASKSAKCAKCGGSMKCGKCDGTVAAALDPAALDKLEDESPEAKRGFKAELLKLSGKSATSEALGVVMGWKAAAEKNVELEAELSKLRGSTADAEVETVVAAAEREGKVTPATRVKLVEMGKKDLPMLKSYLAAAPRIAPQARTEPGPAGGGKKGGGKEPEPENGAELSDEDVKVLSLLGNDTPEARKALSLRKRELGDIPRLQ